MSPLNVFVPGIPRPQGSKRHVGNGVIIESSKGLRQWRQEVVGELLAWRADNATTADGGGVLRPRFYVAVRVDLRFAFPRPKYHYRTGKRANELKNAYVWATMDKPPDVDKLARAIFDALTISGVIADDSMICAVHAVKCYDVVPGVDIRVDEWTAG